MKVDIRASPKAKNPALYRWVPGWLLGFLARSVRESEINDFLSQYGHLKGLDFVKAVLDFLEITVVVRGAEHLPPEGPLMVAANHPLGGLDGLALYHVLGQHRSKFVSVSNDLISQIKPLEEFFVPVNKHGQQNRDTLHLLHQRLSEGYAMVFFPAGLVSRRQNGMIRDLEWKKSFVALARKHQTPIVPTFIKGQLSERFYRLATWRKQLRIPWNLEMFLLPDELFRYRRRTIEIRFGAALTLQDSHLNKEDQVWAARLRERVYALGAMPVS